jgi:hypothetical protein
VLNISRQDGFTISEMMISTTIMLLVVGAALTTFKNGLMINDSAAQMADANQNLRAGTNTLIRDLMMAGRIIGAEGIAMPTGAGVVAFSRPGPPGSSLTFVLTTDDIDVMLNLPSITTGDNLGPMITGETTDIVTLLTIDEFSPVVTTPPVATPTAFEGTIAADGRSATLPLTSAWLVGDIVNDTRPLVPGDLVYFKGQNGNAIQTITSVDTTHIYFAPTNANDWFHFNQPTAPNWPMAKIKGGTSTSASMGAGAFPAVTMMRALMLTYYVDSTTTPSTPRLTRVLNHFTPQALAGVVEDLDLTYDLVDSVLNPNNISSLPYTDGASPPNVYNSNQIRKVNVHIGVRSEMMNRPNMDYIRNHVTTSVDVRNLASVDRYRVQ